MALTAVDSTVAANVAAATTQEGQRAAMVAPFADDDVTVRFYAGATLAETGTFGPVVTDSDTPRGWTLGPLLASTVHVADATITHAIYRTAGGQDILQADAADLTLTAPTTKAGRRTNLADAVRTKVRHTAQASLPTTPPPAAPTTATLSGSDTATTSAPHTSRVTLDVAADQTYTVTWSRSDSATGSATSDITTGQTYVEATSTWGAAGTGRTVDFTISPTLTRAGRPLTVTVADFAWTISDASTLTAGRNITTEIATGVHGGMNYSASPDLLPGQSLALDGTTLNLVGDSTVPTVNGDDAGSAIDTISARDVVIEVMDSPLATFQNLRTGTTYGKAHSGTTWWQCMLASADGDTIEISPGAINQIEADANNYYSNSLDSCGMSIVKGVTIRNIPGRGRWKLYPAGVSFATNRNGIGIFSPADGADISGRLSVTIEGCDLTDQFQTNGAGVRIRSSSGPGTWLGNHAALTLRNFKIGRTAGASLSGISGTAELMTMEDGHIFDCGNGSGQEHNVYIGARVLTMRGVRFSRTRGWVGTPWSGGTASLEGHQLKVSAVTGILEGCVIDCARLADQSELLQMKAGGNWTVRGNLFIDSQAPNNANGAILMCREYAEDGVTQNFEWWAGSEGNSLLFEKNVYIGHYPRPIVWFYSQASVSAMRPASGGAWTAAERLDSLTVRDNIAMVATVQPYGSWMLSGFPGASNVMWINQDPNAGANWGDRGNTAMTYGTDEPGFSADEKALLLYRREAGTIAASGSVATKRFVWPHGFIDRTDAFRGLA